MRDAALKSVLGGVRDVALFINFQKQTYPNHFLLQILMVPSVLKGFVSHII